MNQNCIINGTKNISNANTKYNESAIKNSIASCISNNLTGNDINVSVNQTTITINVLNKSLQVNDVGFKQTINNSFNLDIKTTSNSIVISSIENIFKQDNTNNENPQDSNKPNQPQAITLTQQDIQDLVTQLGQLDCSVDAVTAKTNYDSKKQEIATALKNNIQASNIGEIVVQDKQIEIPILDKNIANGEFAITQPNLKVTVSNNKIIINGSNNEDLFGVLISQPQSNDLVKIFNKIGGGIVSGNYDFKQIISKINNEINTIKQKIINCIPILKQNDIKDINTSTKKIEINIQNKTLISKEYKITLIENSNQKEFRVIIEPTKIEITPSNPNDFLYLYSFDQKDYEYILDKIKKICSDNSVSTIESFKEKLKNIFNVNSSAPFITKITINNDEPKSGETLQIYELKFYFDKNKNNIDICTKIIDNNTEVFVDKASIRFTFTTPLNTFIPNTPSTIFII